MRNLVVATTVLSLGVLLPGRATAVDACRVRIGSHDGVLRVYAKGVTGVFRWGGDAGSATNPFANAATCVAGGAAVACELGAAGTPEQITPPQLCALYLADDGPTACVTHIKPCTPGLRSGEPGPDGPQGPAGPAGPAGPTGPPGQAGADGASGPQGPQGLDGPTGPPGADGASGPQGPQGASGPSGPAAALSYVTCKIGRAHV